MEENGVFSSDEVQLNCRFYEQMYPEVDDLVMVKVRDIDAICAFVKLLEYNNQEAIIQLSELSRRRMKSVHKHIRIGTQEVLQVLRVDKEKGYIDLSKKNLSGDDIVECQATYNRSKIVHSIMKHVAGKVHVDTEKLYQKFGWAMYTKYSHAYEGFKKAVTDMSVFDEFELDEKTTTELAKAIQHRFALQPVKVQADVEVTCFSKDGIDAIIPALRAGRDLVPQKELQKDELDESIKIYLISTPVYSISILSLSEENAVDKINEAIEVIKTKIEEKNGTLVVKEAVTN